MHTLLGLLVSIEEKIPTGDGQGHGPGLGSEEWQSVVEFKLGIRDRPSTPDRISDSWCRHIDNLARKRFLSRQDSKALYAASDGQGPSFSCNEVATGSIG